MIKVVEFIKKPRNVYFSIIAMLTLVTGLFSISFSYYIDESNNTSVFAVSKVDNRLQCDGMVDCSIELLPNETKELKVYVMSNNDFESQYKLYYLTNDSVEVVSEVKISNSISSHDVQEYNLLLRNKQNSNSNVLIEIENGYSGTDIVAEGKEIETY